MADSTETAGPAGVQWVKATSLNGVNFEIGTTNEDAVSELASVEGRKTFRYSVEESGTLYLCNIPTPTILSNAAQMAREAPSASLSIGLQTLTTITTGSHNGTQWKYILNFTNTYKFDYYFYDETGDNYHVNTYRRGDHYVRFNSDKPKIIFIRGQ
ncbi:hypothetical protein EVG20_g5824 [Dentipellis fragilis]|uniref:Uncharacterized protein n=1 Tax=Dentipellis fragilis TaxID=205917 RepID=A0A4Y9YRN4_9AGAM|nr:hypothetical protein EVG20_g5824 [Dentipellis fragilis]